MIPQDRHVPERLLLVRHGQTQWEREHRLHGQLDSALTEDGIRQANVIARRLHGRGIMTVCSSPLGRAMSTACIIADLLGAELIEVPELADVHHGDLAGLTWDEVDQRFPAAREERAANRYGWAFPGGESYAQARARARRALSACGWAATGTPVIVTHEMIGRMVRAELRGLDIGSALGLRHPHDVVFDIDHGVETIL